MYKQMSYEDIRKWAEDKIREKSYRSSIDIPSPIQVNYFEDAVGELVLENCPDIGLMTPKEILDKQGYVDEINRLKAEIGVLKQDKNRAFEYLQKGYDSVYSYVDFIKSFVGEIKSGRKSVYDLENETQWVYAPPPYTFIQCAEALGKKLNER